MPIILAAFLFSVAGHHAEPAIGWRDSIKAWLKTSHSAKTVPPKHPKWKVYGNVHQKWK